MDFQIASSKVFGNSEGRGWIQVHDFTPSDREKLLVRGRLFAVISGEELVLGEDQEMDKVLAGREILTRLHEEYYGKTEGSAFYGLKNAVSEVNSEFLEAIEGVEIAAAAYLEGVVYAAVTEGAFVNLYRKGALVKILEGGKGGAVSASGHPKSDDVLILGSKDFGSFVGYQKLKQALSKNDLEEIKESIIPTIRSAEDGSRTGAIFIKFFETSESVSVATFAPKNSTEKTDVQTDSTDKTQQKEFAQKGSIKERIIARLPNKSIRIKGQEIDRATSKRRRVAVSVGIILLVLLLVSILFGMKAKQENDKRQLFEDTINEATHQLEEAVSLYDLNPSRSRELFNQSKTSVEALIQEGVDYPEVIELQKRISENEARILGEYRIEPDLFLDLTLLSEGFYGTLLSASENIMVILDSDNKRLVSVEIDSKRTEVIAGDNELNEPRKAAVYAGRFFILEGGAVYEIDGSDKEEAESGFSESDMISAFAGNIYVLSKSESQIFRVAGSEDGFSDKSEWLSEGVEPEFSDAVSWSIDGNIWVLNADGEILRYSLGNELNFRIMGVFPPVDSGASIFTDEDSEYIYVLEPQEGRIVVSDKDGEYAAQYISDDLNEGRSIIVSESEKLMIVLTGEKLLSVELKHLNN